MQNLHSNSKDTFIYWLRDFKNSLPNPSYTYLELQEMITSLLSAYNKQNQSLHEVFNDVYALAYDEDNNVIITTRKSKMYKEHPYN